MLRLCVCSVCAAPGVTRFAPWWSIMAWVAALLASGGMAAEFAALARVRNALRLQAGALVMAGGAAGLQRNT
jgi:hypothetical protein